ncbi:hypothetical protein [Shimia sp.]|uniref:hypothetical protein n=1 Tax=unclassified Shimia TaxID=2630038 RepID=UPI0025ED4A4D|nr:hypothetical protein [Shimia sp.]MCH2065881.1 hypothetical protein [Shimia sp.]
MKYVSIVLALLSSAAAAQDAMSAAEFEAYVSGKTLFYEADGRRYGVEEYLSDRRVRWAFLDGSGQCKDGYWYEDAGQICFVYEDTPGPQCWSFYEDGRGLSAKFENEPDGRLLYEIEDSSEEMLCLGPDVGV